MTEWWTWPPPEVIRHRDRVVRLHGGPRHGDIVELNPDRPPPPYIGTVVFPDPVTVPPADKAWDPSKLAFEEVHYVRRKLVWYDDVAHQLHEYDYWTAAKGGPW